MSTASSENSGGIEADRKDASVGGVKIRRGSKGRLIAELEGREDPIEDVRIARCFPWSLPETYISIRDSEGKEIKLVENFDELDDETRGIITEELHDKVFNPQIQRVLDHKDEFGVTSFTVETDRGVVTFQIRSRDDIRILSSTRALFRDPDGNTYELADLTALDPASQKYFQDYF